MAFENLEIENLDNLKNERILFSLSRSSPLLDFLRAMYSLVLDYGVYLGDKNSEPLIFSKDQLVFLIERGQVDLLLKDLPELERAEVIHAIRLEEFASPENIQALIIEKRGVSIGTLAGAFNPNQTEYPVWWTAPIPFAKCTRDKVKLNPAALSEFGSELERLNAAALPEKDEFIVELEGKDKPYFLSFRRLAAGIFTLEDCTGDLVEAQDISWWAGLGRLWINLLEAGGHTWRRLENAKDLEDLKLNLDLDNIDLNKAEDLEKIEAASGAQILPCEWQDRFMGYLCIENKNKNKINNENESAGNNFEELKPEGEELLIKDEDADIEVEESEYENDENNDDEEFDEDDRAVEFIEDEPEPEAGAGQNLNLNLKLDLEDEEPEENIIEHESKDEDKNINTAGEQINKSPEPEAAPEEKEEEEPDTEENALLKAISPQTMGLLAPGVNNYNYYDNLYESEREIAKAPVKRRLKGDFRA